MHPRDRILPLLLAVKLLLVLMVGGVLPCRWRGRMLCAGGPAFQPIQSFLVEILPAAIKCPCRCRCPCCRCCFLLLPPLLPLLRLCQRELGKALLHAVRRLLCRLALARWQPEECQLGHHCNQEYTTHSNRPEWASLTLLGRCSSK